MARRPNRWTWSSREALPEYQKWYVGPLGEPGVVGRPSRRDGSDWEVHPEGWEWSGGPPGWPEVVGRSSRRIVVVGRQSRRDGSIRNSYRRAEMVIRPSCWAGNSRKALLEGQEWSKGPPGGQGVVGRSSQRVGRPSRRAGSIWEAHPEGRECSGAHPEGRDAFQDDR